MSRARRAARGQDRLGIALIALALLGLGGFALAAVMLRPAPTDAQTLCRTDAPLRAHTIVLVDSTDKLEPRHRRRLRVVADQERARLSEYDRFTVMRLDWRRPREPAILFSKCLPKAPDETNPFIANPRRAQERWEEEFGARMDAALKSAGRGGAARASPILESIAAAAADPEFGPEITRRRLVFVSDLLEHDPDGFSLYAEGATYPQWLAANPMGAPDLSGVELRIAMLDRPDQAERQHAARTAFWEPYTDATQAKSVTFDPSP